MKDGRHMCPVCDEVEVENEGTACGPCTVLALRAYGWAQGTPMPGGGLRRGPLDEDAMLELDALTGRDNE